MKIEHAIVPTIRHDNERWNNSRVNIGPYTFVFSYETCVGFYSPLTDWIVCKNQWGPTTGKHLAALCVPKADRLDYEEFVRRMNLALVDHNIEEAASLT